MRLRGKNIASGLTGHTPVMINEVLHTLSPHHDAIYVDGTFGAGGYSRAILDAANCKVVAIDRDPEAIVRSEELATEFPERFQIIEGRFGQMDTLLATQHGAINGAVLDIGVSSQQLNTPERGFSFQADGPLDMRMSRSGKSAADVVNTYDEKTIADIIWRYGEEKKSRAIAKCIVKARLETPLQTTQDLKELVHRVMPRKPGQKIDPATRTFQALRIYVNRELEELELGLKAATRLLAEGGRLVVVTFHSLEDSIVKSFFKEYGQKKAAPSRYAPFDMAAAAEEDAPIFKLINRSPLRPTDAETLENPRSRSAKLRWGIKVGDTPEEWCAQAEGVRR